MITQEAITINNVIPHKKLNPKSVDEFLEIFEDLLKEMVKKSKEFPY